MLMVMTLAVVSLITTSLARLSLPEGVGDVVGGAGEAVVALLEADPQPHCSVILLTDSTTPPYTIFKVVGQVPASCGVGVFEVAADGQDGNVTQGQVSRLVGQARRLRQLSWCVTVVVVSDDPAFLAAFAQWSLKGRLLVWPTRLLVVTRLPLSDLRDLLSNHWTFSMMNVMVLILDEVQDDTRCVVYSHLPYSARGADIVRVASWTPARGLTIFSHQKLFPEKFTNFYGSTVSLTGVHWPPYIVVYDQTTANGTSVKRIKGPDGLLAEAVGQVLNYTYTFLPAANWIKAADRVVERKSLMVPVFHLILSTRLERYDYSYTYIFVSFRFGLAKPELKPQWQSLYYPLADEVWVFTLATLLMMPGLMFMTSMSKKWKHREERLAGWPVWRYGHGNRGVGAMTQEIIGTFLGQNLARWLPKDTSSRVLMAGWLVFAFIIGTVYRGNLTAALTLPRYPPRPETLEEVVNHVDSVTVIPVGKHWRDHFRESGSSARHKLADMMHIGPSLFEGLQLATEKKSAHIDERHVLSHWIAEYFTGADGSTPLYVAQETVIPGAAGWPIPHDAPYKPQLDSVMMAVNEAGLYDKWNEDELDKAERDGRRKQREAEEAGDEAKYSNSNSNNNIKPLTLVHLQGSFMLLFLGLIVAGFSFITERFRAGYTD